MSKKIFIAAGLTTVLTLTVWLSTPVAHGAGIIPNDNPTPCSPGSSNCDCPAEYTGNCGAYEVDDFIILAVNVAKWILGIVGSLSLLMFIYGGLTFLISAGSSDKITKAKGIIIAAVIGLIIVFSSWLIIRFVMQSLGLPGWEGKIISF
jgi:hypothetical protein